MRVGRSKLSALLGALLLLWVESVSFAQPAPLLFVPESGAETLVDEPSSTIDTWPDGQPVTPDPVEASTHELSSSETTLEPPSDARGIHDDIGIFHIGPRGYTPVMSWLGLRHSHTNGRNVGLGRPLVGTSWLNRPYYWGGEIGTLWMTRSLADGVSRDSDAFGGVFFGWDWDHFWGSELRFDWSTPELKNSLAPDAPRTDSLFMWNCSFMYYPWGDSYVRPYWRWGIGNTHVDFPTQWGTRQDEWLVMFPISWGVKYPVRRWLAARAELTDQLAIGQGDIPTQHNLTLTFGLEWHFGVRPKSYFPWYPSRHFH